MTTERAPAHCLRQIALLQSYYDDDMARTQTAVTAHGADVLGAADDLLVAMAAIRRAGRQRGGRPLELAALTSAQLELVRLLRRQPGLCVAEAAQELRLAPNTVSTLVRELAEAGVVERRVDKADRRVARLDLVFEMRRKLERWRDERVVTLASAIDKLPRSDRRALLRALPLLDTLADAVAEAP